MVKEADEKRRQSHAMCYTTQSKARPSVASFRLCGHDRSFSASVFTTRPHGLIFPVAVENGVGMGVNTAATRWRVEHNNHKNEYACFLSFSFFVLSVFGGPLMIDTYECMFLHHHHPCHYSPHGMNWLFWKRATVETCCHVLNPSWCSNWRTIRGENSQCERARFHQSIKFPESNGLLNR